MIPYEDIADCERAMNDGYKVEEDELWRDSDQAPHNRRALVAIVVLPIVILALGYFIAK